MLKNSVIKYIKLFKHPNLYIFPVTLFHSRVFFFPSCIPSFFFLFTPGDTKRYFFTLRVYYYTLCVEISVTNENYSKIFVLALSNLGNTHIHSNFFFCSLLFFYEFVLREIIFVCSKSEMRMLFI